MFDRENYSLKFMLLVGFITAVVLFQSFNAICYPVLHCEDGKLIFAYYMNHDSPGEIFRFYNGYISFIPNLIGYMSTFLSPVKRIYLMVSCSVVLTVMSFSVFALKRFRRIIPDDTVRMLICGAMALFSFGNFALRTTLMFSLWHLLWLFLMLNLAPVTDYGWRRWAMLAFLVGAAWSHPMSVIGLPVLVWQVYVHRSRGERWFFLIQIVAVILYIILGIAPGDGGYSFETGVLVGAAGIYLERVVFESLFGSGLRYGLAVNGYDIYIYSIAVVVCLTAVVFYRRARRSFSGDIRLFLLGIVALSGGMTFLGAVTRPALLNAEAIRWGHRYFYLQQVFFLIFLAVVGFYFIGSFRRKSFKIITGISLVVVFLFLSAFKFKLERPVFTTSREAGRRVIRFARAIESGIQLRKYFDRKTKMFILDRGGTWDIAVRLNTSHIRNQYRKQLVQLKK